MERFSWHELLDTLQINDSFIYHGGPRFSWNNGRYGQARRMARLDRFYTPVNALGNTRHTPYFIHGYSVGFDHSPVQVEICLGPERSKKLPFKWNVDHLKGEIADQLGHMWASLPFEMSFFAKLRRVSRLFRMMNIQKTKDYRKEDFDLRAKLEIAIACLHEDAYNVDKQGKVWRIKNALEQVENKKAKGATIRSRVKWNKVGNRCTSEFFNSVKQKNTTRVISELQDIGG